MTIRDRISSGEFDNKVPYPPKDMSAEMRAEAMTAYRQGEQERIGRFRLEIAREYKMVTHPKEELVWNKAWDHGHADGLGEVAYWYEEFVEVVR